MYHLAEVQRRRRLLTTTSNRLHRSFIRVLLREVWRLEVFGARPSTVGPRPGAWALSGRSWESFSFCSHAVSLQSFVLAINGKCTCSMEGSTTRAAKMWALLTGSGVTSNELFLDALSTALSDNRSSTEVYTFTKQHCYIWKREKIQKSVLATVLICRCRSKESIIYTMV